MEAQDRGFEEAWQQALEGAECNPPDRIWAGIEDALDGRKRKPLGKHKYLWMLKLAMAASILYGMSTTGLNLNEQGFFHENLQLSEEVIPEVSVIGSTQIPRDYPAVELPAMESVSEFVPVAFATSRKYTPELPAYEYRRKQIRKFPILPLFYREKETGFRTSMNFTGGKGSGTSSNLSYSLYDVNSLSESSMVRAEPSQVNLNGPVLNAGFGFRARFSNRWVIQSGINYQERSGSGTARYIQATDGGDRIWFPRIEIERPSNVRETMPYAVDHKLRYVSVPVQAGYVLLDEKVDVTLYGGISNDILVSHSVSDPVKEVGSVNITDSSSFKKYAVSGILTAEISYDLGDNYSLSVYPQLRKALTSLTEDQSTKPLTMEMGVRLSYNIN